MDFTNSPGRKTGRIVILGAGTAGTMTANRLAKLLPEKDWHIVVCDEDDRHVYQPGLLFVPFGQYRIEDLFRPRHSLLQSRVDMILEPVDRVDAAGKKVLFKGGAALEYDILVIATGTRVAPEDTEGLTGPGWYDSAFDFYTAEGAAALHDALKTWKGGRLVVNIADLPIKCPVAPLEFLFLADAHFTERGMRDKVEIVYATPLDGAFTKPRAAAALGGMLEARNIQVEPSFQLAKVDGTTRTMEAYDGRTLSYDLLVSIPLHRGSALIGRSALGDASDFVPTDRHTLQSKVSPDIFVIGDATDLPTSKAGSVAHFEGETLVRNILHRLRGEPLEATFDGPANCFIETGHGQAMLIDFNYETEPLPGKLPMPGVGPFDLLAESHMNHWGKLGFRWVYWNVLVRGDDLPIDDRMALAGKEVAR